jgi:iron complex outermembrane receptor protein
MPERDEDTSHDECFVAKIKTIMSLMRTILATVFLVTAEFAFSQFDIRIVVQDINGYPVPSLHVMLDSLHGTTDDEGSVVFILEKSGSYLLEIRGIGIKTIKDTLWIEGDEERAFQVSAQVYDLSTIELIGSWVKPDQPFTYTNQTNEDFEKRNMGQDVPYLLKSLPSTVVTSDAGTGIGYTGLRIRGSDPSRINVTIDGVPLNDSESQGVFWVDLPDFVSSTEAIQVQRGVGTSTHGAGAFGGTINLATNAVEIEPYAELSASGGSFNTLRGTLKLGSGMLGNHFTFDGRASAIRSDGYIDRGSADLKSFFLSGKYIEDRQSLRVNLFSGKEFTYQAWNGVPAQYISTDRTYNGAGLRPDGSFHEDQVDNYRQTHLHMHYTRSLAYELLGKVSLHYTKGKGYFELYQIGQDLSDFGIDQLESDLIERRWLDNDFYGIIFSLHSKPSEKPFTWTFGGGWNQYLGDHFGEVIWTPRLDQTTGPWEYYRNDAIKRDWNIYFQYQRRLLEGLNLFTDLQWRTVNYRFLGFNEQLAPADQKDVLHFFNPKLGLVYQRDETTWYYSAAVAQREPNRSDYTGSSPGSRPEAEFLIDHELGLRMSNNKSTFGMNLFYMKYRDQLVLTGKLNDVGEYVRTNVPDSYRTGVELVANVSLSDNFHLNGNATFSANRIRSFVEFIDDWDTGGQLEVIHDDSRIAFSPGAMGNLSLAWDFIQGRKSAWQANFMHQYVGSQYLDNTESDASRLEGYQQSDLGLTVTFNPQRSENIRVNLLIRNLFDNQIITNGWIYRFQSSFYDARPDDPYARLEGGNTFNLTGYYPQAGINALVGLIVRF